MKNCPPDLLTWLEQVDARWRACGLDMVRRSVLGADLAADLREALAGGAHSSDLVGEPAEVFADRLALAAGAALAVPPSPPEATPQAVVLTGMAGAGVAGLLVWLFLLPGLAELVYSEAHETVSLVTVYLVCGLMGVAGCLSAIRMRFGHDPLTGRVVRYVAPAIVAFGLLSIGPAVALAWLLSYSTSPMGVVLVGGLVLGFLAAGIYLGHRLAHRQHSIPA